MSTYLIDTHVLLRLVAEPQKLSSPAKDILTNKNNNILVSWVSFREIAIKSSIGKLHFATSMQELQTVIERKNIEILHPTIQSTDIVTHLPFYQKDSIEHRDPFDRLLIAQATEHTIPIITADQKFTLYPNITLIW